MAEMVGDEIEKVLHWRRRLVTVLCTAWLTTTVGLQGAEALAGAGTLAFCGNTPAVDYASPFMRMPPLHRPPKELPFSVKGLHIYRSSEGPIIPGKGSVRFGFQADRGRERALKIGLTVKASFVHIDGLGRSVAMPKRTQQRLINTATVNRIFISFPVSASPAFYRFAVNFFDKEGRKLGSYGEYVRVVSSRLHFGLQTDAPYYRPGEVAHVKVLNYGTEPISFGPGVSVEVFNGSFWTPSDAFALSPIPKVAFGLEAGQSSPCELLKIPAVVPAGSYRVTKLVSPLAGKKERMTTAAFEIGS